MPDAAFLGYLLWLLMTALALGLVYLAAAQRLYPSFLLPLAVGLLLANLPPHAPAALAYFREAAQYPWLRGLYPPVIFLCFGAGIDLSPLLAHPRQLFLGLLQPLIFLALLALGIAMGLSPQAAASGVLASGGDGGVSALFLAGWFAPDLAGPIGLTAAVLVALLPYVQPPLCWIFTTPKERLIRMAATRKVAKRETMLFALAALVIISLALPGALPLAGMFFLGNLLKESGVVERLARTLTNRVGEVAVALLGLAVGSRASAAAILSLAMLKVLALGLAALVGATVLGVLAVKVSNLFCRNKINPLVGAAVIGLPPYAAQVAQMTGRREDPHSNLFAHAQATSQAAMLAATLTAGLLWGILG
jgi:oxaloacetate decarboxylase beta subunit